MCAIRSELQLLQESYLGVSESFTCEVWSFRAKACKWSFRLEWVEGAVMINGLGAHKDVLQSGL